MSDVLMVNEIYLSLQGESTYSGLPCIFVRLAGCNLRCSYCDTSYAFIEGRKMPLPEIHAEIRTLGAPFGLAASRAKLSLVELTGGEPLLQKGSLRLMTQLCEDHFTVLLETSGAHDISEVDSRVHRIMDLKCPSSGEAPRNRYQNIEHLRASDEIKFVIGTVEDYEWTRKVIDRYELARVCPLLFSWVSPLQPHQRDHSLKAVPSGQTPISRRELAERIIADKLPVRFQLQMHKFIWPPDARGV